ncbi:hypothetical protein SAMN05421827_12932 [Pedobacter terrae]|uniref:Uncharacterized protein n=1 Tax=Pedobacter terrae TaxID=405671 RepID=A0A1G8DGN2_9SPHI|nr:hypothetical protein SAMN05421827_12932 [Pedobacter terrae]
MHFLNEKFAIGVFFSFYCERIASAGAIFLLYTLGDYRNLILSNDLIVY